jgi:hypothetical protein
MPDTRLGTREAEALSRRWAPRVEQRRPCWPLPSLNDLFVTDGLTDRDLINYAYAIRDKVRENERVMNQTANNSPEQALLGDFPGALDDAVMESGEAHQNQMMQYLNDKGLQAGFQKVVFEMLLAAKRPGQLDGGRGNYSP